MEILGDDEVKKISCILAIIGIAITLLGIILQYVDNKCKTIDKNTDFWVRNCDYK